MRWSRPSELFTFVRCVASGPPSGVSVAPSVSLFCGDGPPASAHAAVSAPVLLGTSVSSRVLSSRGVGSEYVNSPVAGE